MKKINKLFFLVLVFALINPSFAGDVSSDSELLLLSDEDLSNLKIIKDSLNTKLIPRNVSEKINALKNLKNNTNMENQLNDIISNISKGCWYYFNIDNLLQKNRNNLYENFARDLENFYKNYEILEKFKEIKEAFDHEIREAKSSDLKSLRTYFNEKTLRQKGNMTAMGKSLDMNVLFNNKNDWNSKGIRLYLTHEKIPFVIMVRIKENDNKFEFTIELMFESRISFMNNSISITTNLDSNNRVYTFAKIAILPDGEVLIIPQGLENNDLNFYWRKNVDSNNKTTLMDFAHFRIEKPEISQKINNEENNDKGKKKKKTKRTRSKKNEDQKINNETILEPINNKFSPDELEKELNDLEKKYEAAFNKIAEEWENKKSICIDQSNKFSGPNFERLKKKYDRYSENAFEQIYNLNISYTNMLIDYQNEIIKKNTNLSDDDLNMIKLGFERKFCRQIEKSARIRNSIKNGMKLIELRSIPDQDNDYTQPQQFSLRNNDTQSLDFNQNNFVQQIEVNPYNDYSQQGQFEQQPVCFNPQFDTYNQPNYPDDQRGYNFNQNNDYTQHLHFNQNNNFIEPPQFRIRNNNNQIRFNLNCNNN